jgi:hypothetical protein
MAARPKGARNGHQSSDVVAVVPWVITTGNGAATAAAQMSCPMGVIRWYCCETAGYGFASNPPYGTAVIARSISDEAIHAPASGAMDCFAEPVIGRAFARPVGSQ